MPKITVDGIEYNTEDLSENGKSQLASLQFLEVQMNKIKSELEKMLIREKRIDLFNKCLTFLDARVELDQKGFKEDIFEH